MYIYSVSVPFCQENMVFYLIKDKKLVLKNILYVWKVRYILDSSEPPQLPSSALWDFYQHFFFVNLYDLHYLIIFTSTFAERKKNTYSAIFNTLVYLVQRYSSDSCMTFN